MSGLDYHRRGNGLPTTSADRGPETRRFSRGLASLRDRIALRLSHAAASLSLEPSPWASWVTAVLVTAVMTAIEILLLPLVGEGVLLFPFAAVVIAALVGGRRPGLLALALNLAVAEYLLIPPHYSFALPWPGDIISMSMFALMACIAWYAAVLFRDEMTVVRERDQLMATAAHDLRNPLQTLKLSVDQLRVLATAADFQADSLKTALSLADRQIVRMSTLVEGLLGSSRTLASERQEVDLAEIMGEVAAEMARELEAGGCKLELHLDSTVGMWNRLALRRVAVNLLTNAVRYAPGRPVRIDVMSEGRYAYLQVADHGPGIDERVRMRIFEPYQRGAHAIAGSGLGLYIVRQIVTAHGGSISVHSKAGHGARFVVMLPLGALSGRKPAPNQSEELR